MLGWKYLPSFICKLVCCVCKLSLLQLPYVAVSYGDSALVFDRKVQGIKWPASSSLLHRPRLAWVAVDVTDHGYCLPCSCLLVENWLCIWSLMANTFSKVPPAWITLRPKRPQHCWAMDNAKTGAPLSPPPEMRKFHSCMFQEPCIFSLEYSLCSAYLLARAKRIPSVLVDRKTSRATWKLG